MSELTFDQQVLLRDAAGIANGKQTRSRVSLHMMGAFPKEIEQLVSMGYLAPVHSGSMTVYDLTESGQAIGEANHWWPR